MKGGDGIDSALIVSHSVKGNAYFIDVLRAFSCAKIVTVPSCAEARQTLMDQFYDIILINGPLPDETGEELAKDIAFKGSCQVIFIVNTDYYEEMSAAVEEFGVITVAKPINRAMFWAALKLAKAAHFKLKQLQSQNTQLTQKIEDIRIVNRAKCLLISYLNLNENEAHKYIEKQAMDLRLTKRMVAERILKKYER